ncbi:MAG: flagellin [Limisphaerales bacterium]
MRIAFNSFPDSLVNRLSLLNSQEAQLENQVDTGKSVSQLSDDPAVMQQVLGWQVQNSSTAQYQQNITTLQQQATSSYNAIDSLQTISARASEIATEADGTASSSDLASYATEVNQLIQEGVQAMNSQNAQGEYLFGGTDNSQPPFVATTDASGNVTAVSYQGNDSVPSAEVAAGYSLSAQVPGANTSGSGPAGVVTDSRTGADFFNHLIALRNDLQAGNTQAITTTDLPNLTKDEDNITSQISANGLIQSQLTDASTVASTQSTALTENISKASDADMATTLTRLSSVQTAYQAALESGASLLNGNLSLMSYIQV